MQTGAHSHRALFQPSLTSEKAFHAYGTKMRAVTEFNYLGRVMTNTDDDWPAVAGNIRKVRASWGRLARILGREGADLKVTRSFYIALTQQVLLFGAESWVLTKRMESDLDAFQGRVARRLTGRLPRRGRDGKWVYLPLAWHSSYQTPYYPALEGVQVRLHLLGEDP